MKKQISSISIYQTSKFIGIFYFVLAAIICIPVGIYALLTDPDKAGSAVIFLMPFFYGIFGFICSAITSWIYNIIAGYFGGVEFTFTDVEKK